MGGEKYRPRFEPLITMAGAFFGPPRDLPFFFRLGASAFNRGPSFNSRFNSSADLIPGPEFNSTPRFLYGP
jgi:hypothetical protein